MNAPTPLTRLNRVLRGALIASAATIVAAVSHMFAGGNTPTPVALLVTALIALPLVLIFIGKNRNAFGTFAAISCTQALFHTIFVYVRPLHSLDAVAPLPTHAHHIGMGVNFIPTIAPGSSADLLMWLSHAAAALVTLWLIRSGEGALLKLGRSLARAFPFFYAHVRLEDFLVKPFFGYRDPLNLQNFLLSLFFSRRGPPAFV